MAAERRDQTGGDAANIARQQRFWTRRATSWDHGAINNPGLVKVVDRVIVESEPDPTMDCIDLGCGTGQLTIPLAPRVRNVRAIDVSQAMIDLLLENAKAAGVKNLTGEAIPIERLVVEPGTVDLVVTNYALHHLRDADKAVLVGRVHEWLRPGGRLVIGDMMFGRGGDARDREIIGSKVSLFIRKGPAGWWRIAKAAGRYLLRFQERPVSMATWVRMCTAAGFEDVQGVPVINEAAVVRATKAKSAGR